jgi:hypothetical protein
MCSYCLMTSLLSLSNTVYLASDLRCYISESYEELYLTITSHYHKYILPLRLRSIFLNGIFFGNIPINIKFRLSHMLFTKSWNYLGYNMGLNRGMDINVILQRFQQICGIIKRTSARKDRKETLLRFYKMMVIPTLLYGSECWTLTKRQIRRLEAAEMRFLRSVAGYRLIDHRRNE